MSNQTTLESHSSQPDLDKPKGNQVRLHLCCGPNRRKGWTNVDCIDFGQEVIANLDKPWSFAQDSTVEELLCKDGVEHMASVEHFLTECSRILVPGGRVEISVPHFKNPSAYRVTHLHWFSWSYFDAFPEPHDCVHDLEIHSNRIIVGPSDTGLWKVLHGIVNLAPKWWERVAYASNLNVILVKK